MAYNNGFPVTYQQYYPQYQPIQPVLPQNNVQNAQNQQSNRIWVQGEAGARSYLVAPNNTVELWDSEASVIYLKSADVSGMPSIKILDYTIRDTGKEPSPVKNEVYATKEQVDSMNEQIESLKKKIEKLTKRKEEDDE